VSRSGVSVRGFCCVRGVNVRCFLVVFPLLGPNSDALGDLLAVGGAFGAGAHGAGSGVPRRDRASPAAAPSAGTAGTASGGKAAGGGPSHKLIGHLHFVIQRLSLCVVPFCFLSAIVALCRVILSLMARATKSLIHERRSR
jgi:hypothetical protein